MRERIKRREGIVVSAKMTKTVVVQVDRLVAASALRQANQAAARASWRMTRAANAARATG